MAHDTQNEVMGYEYLSTREALPSRGEDPKRGEGVGRHQEHLDLFALHGVCDREGFIAIRLLRDPLFDESLANQDGANGYAARSNSQYHLGISKARTTQCRVEFRSHKSPHLENCHIRTNLRTQRTSSQATCPLRADARSKKCRERQRG